MNPADGATTALLFTEFRGDSGDTVRTADATCITFLLYEWQAG